VIEVLRVIIITIVGPQMEVCADHHLLRHQFDEVPSKERVSDSFELFRLEVRRRW
jgi:hypothetical protein